MILIIDFYYPKDTITKTKSHLRTEETKRSLKHLIFNNNNQQNNVYISNNILADYFSFYGKSLLL